MRERESTAGSCRNFRPEHYVRWDLRGFFVSTQAAALSLWTIWHSPGRAGPASCAHSGVVAAAAAALVCGTQR